jgi:hypothetical protein
MLFVYASATRCYRHDILSRLPKAGIHQVPTVLRASPKNGQGDGDQSEHDVPMGESEQLVSTNPEKASEAGFFETGRPSSSVLQQPIPLRNQLGYVSSDVEQGQGVHLAVSIDQSVATLTGQDIRNFFKHADECLSAKMAEISSWSTLPVPN